MDWLLHFFRSQFRRQEMISKMSTLLVVAAALSCVAFVSGKPSNAYAAPPMVQSYAQPSYDDQQSYDVQDVVRIESIQLPQMVSFRIFVSFFL